MIIVKEGGFGMMKKIICVLVAFACLLSLTCCSIFKPKDPISAGDFLEILSEDDGCAVEETTEEKVNSLELGDDNLAPQFEKVISATKMNKGIQIDFYERKEVSDAKALYKASKRLLDDYDRTSTTVVNAANYSRYTAHISDEYYIISRIENTIVLASTDYEYKEDLVDKMREIGY